MATCIMIVDDDIDDIDIFVEAAHIVEPNAECISAQNGIDALRILESSSVQPAYIFVDLNMPKLNGKQFIREFRKKPEHHDTKIIVYSTSKMDHDEREVKALGAVEFITKPTSLDRLCSEIARIISRNYHSPVLPR